MRSWPLTAAVAVPWRTEDLRFSGGGVVLETHVIPVGPVRRLSATALRELPTRLARAGRLQGLFHEGEALKLDATEEGAVAELERSGRGEGGVAITPERSISIWAALPTQQLGAVYDETEIVTQVTRDIRLASSLGELSSDEAAVALGVGPVDMLGRVTGPNSMTFPFMGSSRRHAHLEPTEAYATSTLPRIAADIATELAARLTLRLGR